MSWKYNEPYLQCARCGCIRSPEKLVGVQVAVAMELTHRAAAKALVDAKTDAEIEALKVLERKAELAAKEAQEKVTCTDGWCSLVKTKRG